MLVITDPALGVERTPDLEDVLGGMSLLYHEVNCRLFALKPPARGMLQDFLFDAEAAGDEPVSGKGGVALPNYLRRFLSYFVNP